MGYLNILKSANDTSLLSGIHPEQGILDLFYRSILARTIVNSNSHAELLAAAIDADPKHVLGVLFTFDTMRGYNAQPADGSAPTQGDLDLMRQFEGQQPTQPQGARDAMRVIEGQQADGESSVPMQGAGYAMEGYEGQQTNGEDFSASPPVQTLAIDADVDELFQNLLQVFPDKFVSLPERTDFNSGGELAQLPLPDIPADYTTMFQEEQGPDGLVDVDIDPSFDEAVRMATFGWTLRGALGQ